MTERAVVVLGAAGFIGRHVCRTLANHGFIVRGVGNGPATAAECSAWGMSQWLEADITLESLAAIAGDASPVAFLQCAGSGSVAYSYAAPLDDYQRGVVSTALLLEHVRVHATAARVVVVSSGAVYGDHGEIDAAETQRRAPISPYGFNKVAAEDLCDVYCRFFGVRASVVRLFSVYGEGLRKQLLWDAMNKLSRGDARFFGTGTELRDWIHVEDAAELLAAAATHGEDPFEVYNGGHVKATTQEVLTELARCFGGSIKPHFTGEAHVGNPRRLTGDCSRAWRRLGWVPRVELREGLQRYARWFKSEAAGPCV